MLIVLLVCLQGLQGLQGLAGVQGPLELPISGPELNRMNIYQLVFVLNDVMDRKECHYKLKLDDKFFLAELVELVKRSENLANKPLVFEAYRFGLLRDDCNALLQFNRAHLQWLSKCKEIYPDNSILNVWMEENQVLYEMYDNLRDALYEGYYVSTRRESLGNLRDKLDKIDPTWYNQGIMPPHVPVWRFSK